MAEPTEKSPAIEREILKLTGKNRIITIGENKCMTCDGLANNFKDQLSVDEYRISGMCQHCQDSVFDAENEK
jgi:hypothetical protein